MAGNVWPDHLESLIPSLNRPMTRRGFMAAAAATGTAAWLAACGQASVAGGPTPTPLGTKLEGQLHIYNRGTYYLNQDNVKAFQNQFGQTVTQDAYDSNETLLAKIQAGATGYDVVVPTGYMVEIMAKQNLLYPLVKDATHMPNYQYIDNRFKHVPYDPSNKYSIPKDWGTTGFGYRSDLLGTMTSWADFYQAATTTASGKTIVLDGVNEVIGSMLKMLGYSYNSVDQNQLNQAKAKLLALKPHLLAITSVDDVTLMGNGKAILGLDWNGNVLSAQASETKLQYVIPSEGSEFWVDNWSILKTAPDPVAAHAFLNFIIDPKISAKEISTTYYAQCEQTALQYMDQSLATNSVIYPDAASIARLESQVALSPAGQAARQAIWAEFKAA